MLVAMGTVRVMAMVVVMGADAGGGAGEHADVAPKCVTRFACDAR